jgi:hypothetical protein
MISSGIFKILLKLKFNSIKLYYENINNGMLISLKNILLLNENQY